MANLEKKNKLAKEAATAEFNRIVECFNFSISTEAKEKLITMKVNNIDMQTSQELNDADFFIQKIMSGRIKFDEDNKKIIYVLSDPIVTGNNNETLTNELKFGKFTRVIQKSIRIENEKGKRVPINLNEINFGTMNDSKCDAVLMAMTGISEIEIFNNMDVQAISDLKMIGGYFFS